MKNKERKVALVFTILAVVVVIGIVVLIYMFRYKNDDKPTVVGAVFIGKCNDNGWNESHYNGIASACKQNSSKCLVKEQVGEDEASVRRAIKELVAEGCNVVFFTSFGYGENVSSIAEEYPNVAFYGIAGQNDLSNYTSYFARMYQVRYLAGIVAGAQSKTGKIAFVSAMSIPETYRNIDAYALGAKKANPNIKILVTRTGNWEDEDKEREAVRFLAEKGADVFTYHHDVPYVIDEAEKLGYYSTGYDGVYQEYSDKFLTAAVFDWDKLYERILSDYISGRSNSSKDYWLSISEGAVSLYPFSDLVSDKTKKFVESEEKRIRTWRDVFSGEIYDNKGILRCGKDERISDEELFNNIDWYVDGVEVYER